MDFLNKRYMNMNYEIKNILCAGTCSLSEAKRTYKHTYVCVFIDLLSF